MAGPAFGSTVFDRVLNALIVKVRQDGVVENRAVYTAVGINMEGQKTVLGFWANGSEGAKYWMAVLTKVRTAE